MWTGGNIPWIGFSPDFMAGVDVVRLGVRSPQSGVVSHSGAGLGAAVSVWGAELHFEGFWRGEDEFGKGPDDLAGGGMLSLESLRVGQSEDLWPG